jgi:pyruvate dehydrogenase (quinone)
MASTVADVMVATLKALACAESTDYRIKGFTLYATRTILSGEGSELVELTRTNLRELEAE